MIPLRDNIRASRTPFVAWLFLGANLFVFYLQLTAPAESTIRVDAGGRALALVDGFEQFVWRFGLRPVELMRGVNLAPATPVPELLTLLTSMFMHGGWMHLGGNMLYLWIFGDNVEDAMGHTRFLVFYVLSGLFAAGAQILVNPTSSIPMVGASGAIAGVLGAYLVLYPRARVLTAIPIFYFLRMVELPAIVVLGIWILFQIASASLTDSAHGGTAFMAHIGGFVFGLLAVKGFAQHRGSWRVK